MAEMKERGIKLPWDFDAEDEAAAGTADATDATSDAEDPDSFGVPEAEITATVDVAAWAAAKRTAMDCHKTQRQDFGWLLDLPNDLAPRILSPETFVLTRWPTRGIASGLRETSLFDGIDEA
jgi:LmbE family N-acetylglucosaminyl deacetylase